MKLILASSSRYRSALLGRLQIPFSSVTPDTDETPQPGEAPEHLAERLSRAKAADVSAQHPDALVIGSDQVASVDGQVLGKPGTFANGCTQLQLCSGRLVHFYTGLCVTAPGHEPATSVVDTRVQFRSLQQREIERYLTLDEPYDCAGSFKCESLGIALFESLQSDDPSALEGLPLIKLSQMLRDLGLDPLAD